MATTKGSRERQRQLALHTHMASYMQSFLLRCTTHMRQYPKLQEALVEVDRLRLELESELRHGSPKLSELRQSRART